MKKVKTILVLLGIAALIFALVYGYHFFAGLTPARQAEIKHIKSDLVGLKRVIEQYDTNGDIINRYEGRYLVEIDGAFVSFIHEGKNIKLSGTIQIREIE